VADCFGANLHVRMCVYADFAAVVSLRF